MQMTDKNIQNQQDIPQDSVSSDIKSLKAFFAKLSSKTRQVVEKAIRFAVRELSFLKDFLARKSLKKLIQAFSVLIVLLILSLAGLGLFRNFQKAIKDDKALKSSGQVDEKTPTPISYVSDNPSVYANDPFVLRIEEDLNILTAELTRATLREGELLPPKLDFGVSF